MSPDTRAARPRPPPQVKDLVGVLSSPRHLLTDLTLPVLSIFSGKGVDRILQAVLGDTEIEDLWRGQRPTPAPLLP